MKVTHRFTNAYGHTFFGTLITSRLFLCVCDDLKTWMKEPINVGNLVVKPV